MAGAKTEMRNATDSAERATELDGQSGRQFTPRADRNVSATGPRLVADDNFQMEVVQRFRLWEIVKEMHIPEALTSALDAYCGKSRQTVLHHPKHPAPEPSPQLLTPVSLWAIPSSAYGDRMFRV
jgi:hypothetical protein